MLGNAGTIIGIEVFHEVAQFMFFHVVSVRWKALNVIREGFEGPVLPSGPAGHAMRQTTEIHGFRGGSRILSRLKNGGECTVWGP